MSPLFWPKFFIPPPLELNKVAPLKPFLPKIPLSLIRSNFPGNPSVEIPPLPLKSSGFGI